VGASGTAPVLVLDDEPAIRDVVSSCLRVAGYDVVEAEAGWKVVALARDRAFALFMLDVNVPDMSGFDVCERLRSEGIETPVIFLTARDGGPDAAHALRLGGDDYLRKPFDLSELVARVDRLAGPLAGTVADEALWCDDVEIDLAAVEARRGGVPIDLTPTEFRTLEALVRNQGRVLTRYQILDLVWDDDERDPAMVDTVVSRLRRKVHSLGPSLFVTRRGVGYGIFSNRTRW
jgi:two-component system OmpR family response regulator